MPDANDIRPRIDALESDFERYLLQAIRAHIDKDQAEYASLINAASISASSRHHHQLLVTLQRALKGNLIAHASFELDSTMLTPSAHSLLAPLMCRVAEDLRKRVCDLE